MKSQRWCMALMGVAVVLIATPAVRTQGIVPSRPAYNGGFTPASAAQETFEATTVPMPTPEHVMLPNSPEPFEATPELLAYYNARIANVGPSSLPMGPQSPNIAGPEGGAESNSTVPPAAGPDPAAPGTFITLQNLPVPGGLHSNINEPSVAQEGGYVFYTGNWHASRSRCGGNDYGFPAFCDGGGFVFVNPFADMGDFCCDQDTIADNGRQIIIWFRQGLYNHPSGPPTQNRIRLGVSYDAFGPAFGGCFVDIRPIDLNAAWTNQWFDYPTVAVSNDYFWFATNIFSGAGAFLRQIYVKISLDSLAACSAGAISFMDVTALANGFGAPVQGATTQMYFGSHRGTNNSFSVVWWNEDSAAIHSVTQAIPAFTFQSKNSNCTARPGGTNDWTQRGDSRITGGWVRHHHVTAGSGATLPVPNNEAVGQVGFMWNANQGGGFAQPYIEAATFRQDTLAVSGRPFLASGTQCYQYAFASPNTRGDLGVTVNTSTAAAHVTAAFGIDDDYNGAPGTWEVYTLIAGTGGPPDNQWGDYNRNRPNYPSGKMWVSSGHRMNAGAVESRYFVVGRERDQNSYWKFIWSHW